jgi:hypothetical protein
LYFPPLFDLELDPALEGFRFLALAEGECLDWEDCPEGGGIELVGICDEDCCFRLLDNMLI